MTEPTKDKYRIDYSPKCLNCNNYDYSDDYCEVQFEDEPELTYPTCNQFKQRYDAYCNFCGKPYDDCEDSTISEPDGYEEYWGAMVARPDVITGFICDNCGEYNEL